MTIILPQVPTLSVGDEEVLSINYTDALDKTTGELLTGTPTATELDSSDLTISNVGRNTQTVRILGKNVVTNKAVVFKVIGQKEDKEYRIRVSAVTDSTPARTLVRDIKFKVE